VELNISIVKTREALKAPLISVALPIFNGEAHLSEAVESILAQTFTDFEFIIIDDGSTDNTLALLRRYEAIDKRIILISSENCGLVSTLNKTIELARGEWFARMDHDDIAMPQRFEIQLKQLISSKADICGTWIKYFGDGNRHTLRCYESDDAIKVDMLFNSPFAHPSVMMRTSLLKELKYDENCEKAEDYDLWVRAAQANWKMTNVPEVLLKYRIHAAQTTQVAASHMSQARKRIQARYWAYVANLRGWKPECMQQALDMASDGQCLMLDKANVAFSDLLKISKGESKLALKNDISRAYLNAAYWHPDILSAWVNLVRENPCLPKYSMQFKLLILSLFKLKSGSVPFLRLKKIYNLFRR
jgi:glycosyltransferase involved in cell wall biosynthesis